MIPNFYKVVATMTKFGMLGKNKTTIEQLVPRLISDEEASFRLACIEEECRELTQEYVDRNLPKIADALVDLVIFAMGTAALHNLPWENLFDEVIRANNDKQVGSPDKLRNKGNSAVDLIKPEGWKPPNIEAVLKAWGWE